MHLSDFDLRQLEARNLEELPVAVKDRLLESLLRDLIEAREHLAANSSTSSRPPSSDPPWSGPRSEAKSEVGDPTAVDAGEKEPDAEAVSAEADSAPFATSSGSGRLPGGNAGRQEREKAGPPAGCARPQPRTHAPGDGNDPPCAYAMYSLWAGFGR